MKKNKPQVEVYRCEKCKFQSSFIPGQQIVKKCKVFLLCIDIVIFQKIDKTFSFCGVKYLLLSI